MIALSSNTFAPMVRARATASRKSASASSFLALFHAQFAAKPERHQH
jgi:hypothetical protein